MRSTTKMTTTTTATTLVCLFHVVRDRRSKKKKKKKKTVLQRTQPNCMRSTHIHESGAVQIVRLQLNEYVKLKKNKIKMTSVCLRCKTPGIDRQSDNNLLLPLVESRPSPLGGGGSGSCYCVLRATASTCVST